MNARLMKGLEIYRNGGIKQTHRGWSVPSQSGNGHYLVYKDGMATRCNCPDHEMRSQKCKHQWAVEYYAKKETDEHGREIITKTVRVTYPQDWKNYNKAQTQEITIFDQLLKSLTETIPEPVQTFGRPRMSLQEQCFCSIQKVYSQLSQRRAHTLYRNAKDKEQIAHAPHFNAVGKLLNKKEMTPILHKLLALSALPLKSVEEKFAVDSSGFRTSQFNQYAVEKYGMNKHHKWLKGHITVGTKTNIIVSARVTDEFGADSPQFKPMVAEAYENGFEMQEISADKAYSSKANYEAVKNVGGTALIPPLNPM